MKSVLFCILCPFLTSFSFYEKLQFFALTPPIFSVIIRERKLDKIVLYLTERNHSHEKHIAIALVALMLLDMTACTERGNNNETDTSAETTDVITTEAVTEEVITLRDPEPYTGKELPHYYKNHVTKQNQKVNDLLAGIENAAAFVFFADIHVQENTFSSPAVIASILENTPVRDVVFGGDIISSYGVEADAVAQKDMYHAAYGFAHPYFVRGNHDVYNKIAEDSEIGFCADKSLILDWFYSDLNPEVKREEDDTYYYFDRVDEGVRYIVLDTNEVMKYQPYCTVFVDIIEAFNKKTTIDYENGEHLTAKADFSGINGKVVLCLCGHGHIDDDYISDTGCLYYEINDDSFINNGGSKFLRPIDTVDDNAFDVIIMDLDREKIHCVRYGGGEDKSFDLKGAL